MNSIIKLTNGETIIAEIAHEDSTTMTVLEPLALEIAESESGKPMMVALTWVPLTKKVNMVDIKPHHVVAVSDVDDEIDLYYRKSLAVLKGDAEALREILKEEATDEEREYVSERVREDLEYDEGDPWMDKFGQPVEIEPSANTVH